MRSGLNTKITEVKYNCVGYGKGNNNDSSNNRNSDSYKCSNGVRNRLITIAETVVAMWWYW